MGALLQRAPYIGIGRTRLSGWQAARRSLRSAAPSSRGGRSESGCRLLRFARGLANCGLLLFLARSGRALVELIDASGSIDELLLPGKEGMAGRADLDGDLGQGRAGNEAVAAARNARGLRGATWDGSWTSRPLHYTKRVKDGRAPRSIELERSIPRPSKSH